MLPVSADDHSLSYSMSTMITHLKTIPTVSLTSYTIWDNQPLKNIYQNRKEKSNSRVSSMTELVSTSMVRYGQIISKKFLIKMAYSKDQFIS